MIYKHSFWPEPKCSLIFASFADNCRDKLEFYEWKISIVLLENKTFSYNFLFPLQSFAMLDFTFSIWCLDFIYHLKCKYIWCIEDCLHSDNANLQRNKNILPKLFIRFFLRNLCHFVILWWCVYTNSLFQSDIHEIFNSEFLLPPRAQICRCLDLVNQILNLPWAFSC